MPWPEWRPYSTNTVVDAPTPTDLPNAEDWFEPEGRAPLGVCSEGPRRPVPRPAALDPSGRCQRSRSSWPSTAASPPARAGAQKGQRFRAARAPGDELVFPRGEADELGSTDQEIEDHEIRVGPFGAPTRRPATSARRAPTMPSPSGLRGSGRGRANRQRPEEGSHLSSCETSTWQWGLEVLDGGRSIAPPGWCPCD